MSDVGVLVRRFTTDYVRTPVNLVLLLVVPTVFVVVAAGPLAKAGELLGASHRDMASTATAGWAAAFLAGIAMYFQVAGSRAADRRLAFAGLKPIKVVVGRMLTGLVLAGLAAAVALTALAARSGINDPSRVVVATVMFAVIYIGVGAIVGALVATPVNGTLVILLVWVLDVFFGPAMGSADRLVTRGLPTHFLTTWMVDAPTGHAGRVGDLGWALAWTIAATALGVAVLVTAVRPARPRHGVQDPGCFARQLATAFRLGVRDHRRNPALWGLLVLVPLIFIVGATVTTPKKFSDMPVTEHGRDLLMRVWLPDVHPGLMAPIAIASLSAVAGLFVVLDVRRGDGRLALAGFRPVALVIARLGVAGVMVTVATAVSLATAAVLFQPEQWVAYTAGNLLLAVTYALVGAVLGVVFGQVGGIFMTFLVPFLDLGIGQSPMLNTVTPGWASFTPGHGAAQVIDDAAVTPHFDQLANLLVGLGWLAGLLVVGVVLLRPGTVRAAPAR